MKREFGMTGWLKGLIKNLRNLRETKSFKYLNFASDLTNETRGHPCFKTASETKIDANCPDCKDKAKTRN